METLVIDVGSHECKVGFAGAHVPEWITALAMRREWDNPRPTRESVFVANSTDCLRNSLIRTPVGFEASMLGVSSDSDLFEKICHNAFYYKANIDPSEHAVVLTGLKGRSREKGVQVLFETFQVESCYVGTDGLALFGEGRTTGTILSVGEYLTQIIPLNQGRVLWDAKRELKVGGNDVTSQLQTMLKQCFCTLRLRGEDEIVRDVKEKLAYVAHDYEAEQRRAATTFNCRAVYTLPDAHRMVIGDERFRCAEILFSPMFQKKRGGDIGPALLDAITTCPLQLRQQLSTNIVLIGGTTMLPGLPERVKKEISLIAPHRTRIKICASRHRKYSLWRGGSAFASFVDFPQRLISRAEYNEEWCDIVRRKCHW
jgi:actin-related protein